MTGCSRFNETPCGRRRNGDGISSYKITYDDTNAIPVTLAMVVVVVDAGG